MFIECIIFNKQWRCGTRDSLIFIGFEFSEPSLVKILLITSIKVEYSSLRLVFTLIFCQIRLFVFIVIQRRDTKLIGFKSCLKFKERTRLKERRHNIKDMNTTSVIFKTFLYFSLFIILPVYLAQDFPKVLERFGCTHGYCNTSYCPYSIQGSFILSPCVHDTCIDLTLNRTHSMYKIIGNKPTELIFEVSEESFCRHHSYKLTNNENSTLGQVMCYVPGYAVPEGTYSCKRRTSDETVINFETDVHVFYSTFSFTEFGKGIEPATIIWGSNLPEIYSILTQHNCPTIKRVFQINCVSVYPGRVRLGGYLDVAGMLYRDKMVRVYNSLVG